MTPPPAPRAFYFQFPSLPVHHQKVSDPPPHPLNITVAPPTGNKWLVPKEIGINNPYLDKNRNLRDIGNTAKTGPGSVCKA